MNHDQQAQIILQKIQQTMNESDQLINKSQNYIARLKNDLKKIDEQNEKDQFIIDEQIKKIVQQMDESTIQFVADTQ